MYNRLVLFAVSIGFLLTGCKKTEATYDPPTEAKLIFKFKFDSTQVRLNNAGQPSDVAAGNAAQHPNMLAAAIVTLFSLVSTIMHAPTAIDGTSASIADATLTSAADAVVTGALH